MKKASCRRNRLEQEQHARAVKIRKMTDAQLCEYIDGLAGNGQHKGDVLEFLSRVEAPGIGKVTRKKLMEEARRLGYCEGE